MKTIRFITAIALSACAMSAFATPFNGTAATGAPPLPGTTSTIDFEGQPNASFTSLTLGGVTFSGLTGVLRTDNTFGGQYNTRGAVALDNNAGLTSALRFDFSAPVSGFAFLWGASDVTWTLSAYTAGNVLIESMITPITGPSNLGEYIGFQDANIAYATLVSSNAGFQDYIFVDNFVVAGGAVTAAVPEPASAALMGLGLMGLCLLRRRRN